MTETTDYARIRASFSWRDLFNLERTTGNCWGAFGIKNPAGAAGEIVAVPVPVQEGVILEQPQWGKPFTNYFVDVEVPANYIVFITDKSPGGFTVNLQPRLPENVVVAGHFNVQIRW